MLIFVLSLPHQTNNKTKAMTTTNQIIASNLTNEERVDALIAQNVNTVVISDGNNVAYETGFAQFLMDNYCWSNTRSGFTASLSRPKNQNQ